jgi:hypothetical protein
MDSPTANPDPDPPAPTRFGWLGGLLVSAALFEATTRAVLIGLPELQWHLPCGGAVTQACAIRDYLRWRSMGGSLDDAHHPLYGHTLGTHEQGYTINAQRIRSPHPTPTHPPAGKQRVVLLGDSFTFGAEAPDAEIFPTRLAELRPDLDVVSLGVPGFGHDAAWLRYRDEGKALHPDLVVMGHLWLLTLRDASRWYLAPKPWFELEDDELQLHGTPIEPASVRFRRLRLRPWSVDLLTALTLTATGTPAEASLDWELTGAILEGFLAEVRADGALPYVLSMPTTREHAEGGVLIEDQEAWLSWCARAQAPCIDALPAFRQAWQAGQDTRRGEHWNVLGHDLVAQTLAEALPAAE